MAWICPHCNAMMTEQAVEFLDCDRCGERFATARAERSESATVRPNTQRPTTPSFLYSRSAIYLSFGLAAAILIGGLAIVKPWQPQKAVEASKPPTVVSPLGLSGLAYFPPSVNIVAAIQPLPLLAYSARTKTDPRKFLLEAGVPESIFGILDRSKIPLDQIDHLAIGLTLHSVEDKPIPGVVACLKLTRPLADESNFLAQLKAEKNSQQSKDGRTVYSVNAGVPLLLTKLDSQTYLLGLGTDDFAFIAKPHPTGGGHLPKELRETIMSKIDPTSFVWLATDTDEWAKKPTMKFLSLNPSWKDLVAKLAPGRAIAGGVSLEPEPMLRLGVRVADEASAMAVREYLKAKLGERATIGGKDVWATAEAPFEAKEGWLKSPIESLRLSK